MPSYTINSTSTIDGSTQTITQASSISSVEEKSAQEDFLVNVVAVLQSQKFSGILVPDGEPGDRDYLFYDPTPSATQPTAADWKTFVQGSTTIPDDDLTRFNTIVAETFSLGKKFILGLKSAIASGSNKDISFTSRFNYSYQITVGV